jgi:hypothetical protein
MEELLRVGEVEDRERVPGDRARVAVLGDARDAVARLAAALDDHPDPIPDTEAL